MISFQSKGLKSFLQHYSSKASIFWPSALFMVQLSHPYMITGKTIALTIWTFVGKVMFLLFNISAVLVCHSFSSKEQTSFNFMVSVTIFSDFGAQEKKTCHCFHCFPIYLPENDGTGSYLLPLLNKDSGETCISTGLRLWFFQWSCMDVRVGL